ncbi:pitrilysin family protein [Thermoleptolyngbya sp. C42_A2020_037]|uniref:M16 family metallopeptidase n=1 Tax=Thermoleptolyngbya sp. C42_A2020_037 TaxID=2747799 RepID=UPI0019DD8215|nr:pitrilysin family protein [Thermoleptolyngbya sp. C42_A2020_037]MBF2084548.1 insulinase family protein [Thermoleptolyngbya sp. C42_A2020_037]
MTTLLSTQTAQFLAQRYTLENGLTIIHQQVPTPVVTVDVWVQAGAIAEPEPWAGVAHFLEHMIFKGTEKLPPGYFDYVIENYGGVTNAATSHDYAHFFINTTAESLPDTLPCLAELLLRAAIPDEEFERERDVVLEELRQSEDDPDWLGFQALSETVYQTHPYGRSVLGDVERLMALRPEEMRSFHRAHYQPERMTVVIVGNVDAAYAIDLARQAFSDFAPAVEFPTIPIEAEPPLTGIRRQHLRLPRLETARLMMAWVGPGVDQLQSAYGLDVLSVLLAGGRTSRLVRELREERQLVHDIGSSFSLQRDSSLFTITAWLEPEYLDVVEAIVGDRLSALSAAPIPDAELNRVKRLLCNDYAFSTETSSQLAGLYGYYNTIAQAELSVTYPDRIQSLQVEDLHRLASQHLSPCHYAVTTLRPIEA